MSLIGIQNVRVGMETSGFGRWLERLLAELQVELCPPVPYQMQAPPIHNL